LEEWTKKEGPFFLMWGLLRAKNHGMALLVTWGTGLGQERDSYAMLSSFGRCYMEKNESPFKFTFVYRPGKVGCLCYFSLFCPPTSKGHIFSTAWPIWVNFMLNQRVFRALRRNRAILEEWTKKRGAFLPHVGPFRAKNTGMALLVTWGTGLQRSEIRMPCCPRSVDATWGRTNLRSSLPSSIAPAKSAVCPVFAVLPSNFKRPYLSTARPIWVNFMSNERVFRALRRNRAILEEWTKKEGAFLPHVGPFQG